MNSNLEIVKKSPQIVKRKFPGPAGLLPDVQKLNVDVQTLEKNYESLENIFCSQSSVNTFSDETWLEMKKEFKNNQYLFGKYNISWIISNAKSGSLKNMKVAFLAAKIKKIECDRKAPSFVLMDSTGEIDAVVSEELHNDISEFLTINSIIILKNFGVLSMNNTKKLYVVITPNNLLKIYSYINESAPNKNSKYNLKNTHEKEIQIVTIQDFSIQELVENVENLNNTKNIFNTLVDEQKKGIQIGAVVNCSRKNTLENYSIEPAQNPESSSSKNKYNENNQRTKNVFDTTVDNWDLNMEDFGENLELPPPKKFKTKFKWKANNKKLESSVLMLSQSDKDIDDARNALNDIDTSNFFDDF